MENWIRVTFQVIPNGWDEGVDSFRFVNGEKIIEASITWFVAKFGVVSVPPTEADLKAADEENSAGWHTHFEAWKAQGIIN